MSPSNFSWLIVLWVWLCVCFIAWLIERGQCTSRVERKVVDIYYALAALLSVWAYIHYN